MLSFFASVGARVDVPESTEQPKNIMHWILERDAWWSDNLHLPAILDILLSADGAAASFKQQDASGSVPMERLEDYGGDSINQTQTMQLYLVIESSSVSRAAAGIYPDRSFFWWTAATLILACIVIRVTAPSVDLHCFDALFVLNVLIVYFLPLSNIIVYSMDMPIRFVLNAELTQGTTLGKIRWEHGDVVVRRADFEASAHMSSSLSPSFGRWQQVGSTAAPS